MGMQHHEGNLTNCKNAVSDLLAYVIFLQHGKRKLFTFPVLLSEVRIGRNLTRN